MANFSLFPGPILTGTLPIEPVLSGTLPIEPILSGYIENFYSIANSGMSDADGNPLYDADGNPFFNADGEI